MLDRSLRRKINFAPHDDTMIDVYLEFVCPEFFLLTLKISINADVIISNVTNTTKNFCIISILRIGWILTLPKIIFIWV